MATANGVSRAQRLSESATFTAGTDRDAAAAGQIFRSAQIR